MLEALLLDRSARELRRTPFGLLSCKVMRFMPLLRTPQVCCGSSMRHRLTLTVHGSPFCVYEGPRSASPSLLSHNHPADPGPRERIRVQKLDGENRFITDAVLVIGQSPRKP